MYFIVGIIGFFCGLFLGLWIRIAEQNANDLEGEHSILKEKVSFIEPVSYQEKFNKAKNITDVLK